MLDPDDVCDDPSPPSSPVASTSTIHTESRQLADDDTDSKICPVSNAVVSCAEPATSPDRKETVFFKCLLRRLPIRSRTRALRQPLARTITCQHCPFTGSSQRKLRRHHLLKHFIGVEQDFQVYCPARGCQFWGQSSNQIKRHLEEVHGPYIAIKTIYHEDDLLLDECETSNQDQITKTVHKTSELFRCDVDGCAFSAKFVKNVRVHKAKKHKHLAVTHTLNTEPILQSGDTNHICQVEGCDYKSKQLSKLKRHISRKHKQPILPVQAPPAPNEQQGHQQLVELKEKENQIPDDSLPRHYRSVRKKILKRKFMDEDWEVYKPKRAKLDASYSAMDVGETSTTHQAASVDDVRDVRIHLKPHLIHFEPVQRALIEMTKTHQSFDTEKSNVDAMMEQLILEHSTRCESCKNNSDFMTQHQELSQQHLDKQTTSQINYLKGRVSELERELRRVKESFTKLDTRKKTKMSYKGLLGRVSKPSLCKKNEYSIVSGYRIIDLNVLRLALQSAQKCGHTSLIFTEVNPGVSQVDLATQLGLLCSVCGVQTIFSTSSFSEEEPPNYSVNKAMLPQLGPFAYYSLVNIIQRTVGSVKVNVNMKREGHSIPHKAKLFVSVDRKSYNLDTSADDPVDEIIRPDISGNYENIAEPDQPDDIAGLSQSQMSDDHDASKPSILPAPTNGHVGLPPVSITSSNALRTRVLPATARRPIPPGLLKAGLTALSNGHEYSRRLPAVASKEGQPSRTASEIGGDELGIRIDSVSSAIPGLLPIKPSGDGITIDSTFSLSSVAKQEGPSPRGLKIKNFTDLRCTNQDGEAVEEKKHWTTIEGETKREVAHEFDEVVPVPPGTQLLAANVRYSTTDKSNLPTGVYKVKQQNKQFTLVVRTKNDNSTMLVRRADITGGQVKVGDQSNPELNRQRVTNDTSAIADNTKNIAASTPGSLIGDDATLEPGQIPLELFKTPLQIFSMEVSRALKVKLPGLSDQQIQKIVMDKWAKMTSKEKQVYINKATLLTQSLTDVASVHPSLPAGWKRVLVHNPTDNSGQSANTRVNIVLHTPTGDKLRSKSDLADYMIAHNITGISPDVFDFKGIVQGVKAMIPTLASKSKSKHTRLPLLAPASAKPSQVPVAVPVSSGLLSTQLQPTEKSVEKTDRPPNVALNGLVKEVITSKMGMKMVRMVVETSSGEQRETLVPVVKGANGAFKIALPKNFSVKTNAAQELVKSKHSVPTSTPESTVRVASPEDTVAAAGSVDSSATDSAAAEIMDSDRAATEVTAATCDQATPNECESVGSPEVIIPDGAPLDSIVPDNLDRCETSSPELSTSNVTAIESVLPDSILPDTASPDLDLPDDSVSVVSKTPVLDHDRLTSLSPHPPTVDEESVDPGSLDSPSKQEEVDTQSSADPVDRPNGDEATLA